MVREPIDQKEALRLYKAMNCFRLVPETQAMANWLKSELKFLDTANRNEQVDVVFRQRQGASQVIEKILSMVENSQEKINKIEASHRRNLQK